MPFSGVKHTHPGVRPSPPSLSRAPRLAKPKPCPRGTVTAFPTLTQPLAVTLCCPEGFGHSRHLLCTGPHSKCPFVAGLFRQQSVVQVPLCGSTVRIPFLYKSPEGCFTVSTRQPVSPFTCRFTVDNAAMNRSTYKYLFKPLPSVLLGTYPEELLHPMVILCYIF